MSRLSITSKVIIVFTCILLSFSAEAQMVQLLNNFGKYQVRADACGTNGVSCPITIEKPVNATTAYRVYLYYTSTATTNSDPGATALTINGGGLSSAVPNCTNVTSSTSSGTTAYTRYEDVTTLFSPGLNAAPAGSNISYTSAEASPSAIDGEGIIVVWDNPTVMNSAVHVSIGSRTTATVVSDSIATAPINTLQPGFQATLGLGFAFSTGTGNQISTVSINGGVLDVNAGGWDDGATLANGALITLGGYSDSRTTLNDEYYDFASFIPNNSTQVKYDIIMTSGHISDWLNAVYFEITGVFSTTSDTTIAICQGDSLLLGGAMQNTGGVYYDTLTSHLNTDSVVTTTLLLNPIDTIQQTNAICLGDSILLGGAYQLNPGTYYDTLTSTLGCDSILATTLTTIIESGQTSNSICQGDSILIGGIYQSVPGTYIDTLISHLGCDSVVSTTLTLMPLPTIITSLDTSICPEDSATIFVSGAISYQWDNGLGTGLSYVVNPSSTTTYTVIGTGANGCKNSGTVTITALNCDTIEPSSLIIPNVFTPNGDGSNDVFTVIGVNLRTIDGVIYNRWGQLLFSWDIVDGFWDGGDAPDGTYFYIINAEGFDGEEYHKTGSLSLIR